MQRTTKKARLAAATSAAAFAAALALFGSAPAHAAAASPSQPPGGSMSFTVDFTHTTIPGNPQLGDSFVGNGTVLDDNGNQIGTAVDHCDEAKVSNNGTTVECTTIVNLRNGELDIVAEAPIPDAQKSYPYNFDGIVQGGTGAFDGASGDAHLTAQEPGVYHVDVQLGGS